jgi:DNA-directed RNA polymerase subunit H (RpoH/RPB5)
VKFPNSKWTSPLLTMAVLEVLIRLAATLVTGRLCEAQLGRPPSGDLASFSALAPIDAHVHLYKDDSAFGALIQRLKLRILDICVIDDRDPYFKGLEPQRGDVIKVVRRTGGRAVLCTTFSPYEFEEPGFAQRTIRQLDADFAEGAVAVKIYKVMGMEMKSKAGKYVMPMTLPSSRSIRILPPIIGRSLRTLLSLILAGSRPTPPALTTNTTSRTRRSTPTHIPSGLLRPPFSRLGTISWQRTPSCA